MRHWISQNLKKKNCGVIAVAVVANVSVALAAEKIGKDGATTTKELVKGLRKLGYECPDRLQRIARPQLGIAKVVDPKRRSGWHWVVVDGDKIYDGINGNPDGTVNWNVDWKITSYLPVTK
jgi:hypothetical protein